MFLHVFVSFIFIVLIEVVLVLLLFIFVSVYEETISFFSYLFIVFICVFISQLSQ